MPSRQGSSDTSARLCWTLRAVWFKIVHVAATKLDETPAGLEVSLVSDDLPFRAQRAIGLIPAKGLGIGRRALLLALVTFVPIAVWTASTGRALSTLHPHEAMLQHFGVTVRCLLAIPLLVIAEAVAQGITQRLIPYFVSSGLVALADRGRFEGIVRGVVRLRNQSLPWILIGGAIAALLLFPPATDRHELVWAVEDAAAKPHFGFGGFWFLYVVRPIFIGLLLAWLWRLVLLFLLMSRIAKLDLALVPTHPDRAGGLGFLEPLPAIFSLVVLAISAVLASHWGHEVLYHDTDVRSLFPLAGVFIVLMLLLFSAPLLPFAGKLRAAKRAARLQYGALVGRHGREVRRWILEEPVEDPLLDAPEIGPVADTATLYDAVSRMRTFPIGKPTLVAIILPALLPMLPVVAIQIPLKEILLKLLKAVA